MTGRGRDRLRELLDAVLAEGNPRLADMAGDAYSSPFHFSRLFARGTGEPPVALRRRVMLERAAWQIQRGVGVTDASLAAGYASVEGFIRAFSRAFGHPPGSARRGGGHRLPAPNGIHFHPPTALWVDAIPRERPGMELTAHLLHHDLDDTRDLIDLAAGLPAQEYAKVRAPGLEAHYWDGPLESIPDVLDNLIWTKEVWLAAIHGDDMPERGSSEPDALRARLDAAGARWLDTVRDIDERDRWGDTLIDALCDPPESFVMVSVVAHVITFAAHRRQLARDMLRDAGVEVDVGDPIDWLRGRS
ncbi:MAG: helix-turn-helix domain-containing protein [Thermoleophilia bacterium]